MKQKMLLLGVFFLFGKTLSAQVGTNGLPNNRWMGLTPTTGINSIRSVGFGGNFSGTGGAVPQARLHLSDYGWDLPTNGSIVQGRLFRTDGLFSAENSWSMWSGTAPASALERFRLAVYANSNNVYLGTIQNGWFNVRTNNLNRMKLNGDYGVAGSPQYAIDGYGTFGNTNTTVNTSGYLLLGPNAPLTNTANPPMLYDTKGAFSLLHLNGAAQVQQNGYRPWMKTGITFTDNQDLTYFGLRQMGTGLDYTETVLNWSDNSGTLEDDMCFRFNGGTTSSITIDQVNLRSTTDLDGLHIARYTANGRYGLGNTFGYTNAPGHPINFYVSPQSLFHMSYDHQPGLSSQPYGFMQITFRKANSPTLVGVGETSLDGLRLGIDNQIIQPITTDTTTRHLNGYLRWQEASSFVVQTSDGVSPITSNERMRITSTGALNQNYKTNYLGIDNPLNTTRISISESGSTPLVRPMSLMHLGYDYGFNVAGTPLPNGYRTWMDLGTLTSTNRDHLWVGLKPRISTPNAVDPTNDRLDAVIAWGTDGQDSTDFGSDVMRFIFTADSLAVNESPQSRSQNGLEVMRLYAHSDTTTTLGGKVYGRVGIGDFTASGVGGQPTHKLDVVGNGRFRYLPDTLYKADSTVNKIVMVDSLGVLRWSSFVPSSFGAECIDSVNGKLQFDTKVDMNNYNLYFTRNDTLNTNQFAIGYDCGTPLDSKFNVYSKNERWSGGFYVDGNSPIDSIGNSHQGGVKSIIDSTKTINATAIYGYVAPNLYTTMVSSIGVKGEVLGKSVKEAVGVYGQSTVTVPTSGAIGGRFLSNGSASGRAVQAQNFTVQSNSTTGSGFGFGGDFNCNTTFGQNVNSNTGVVGSANGLSQSNTGVRGLASGNGVINMGVYGQATGGGQNWAGYFQGDVYISGTFGPSDENLKENVISLENADSLIGLLNPVTFDFKTSDYPQLQLQDGNQMGLIAQQVEPIFPSLVKENTSPAQYDSLGNVTVPSVNFKTVDYTKLIPLLISGHQEQTEEINAKDATIDSLQNQVDDLNARLSNLENCLSALLPTLCSMNQSLIQNNTPAQQEAVRKNLNVTLSDRNAIILDQNVPNPFAEQTVINFSIPATVVKAQIHFYDGNGKLIQSVDVTERGLGSLTVFGSDLSTGVYTYTLVADGQIVATKKMMKQ